MSYPNPSRRTDSNDSFPFSTESPRSSRASLVDNESISSRRGLITPKAIRTDYEPPQSGSSARRKPAGGQQKKLDEGVDVYPFPDEPRGSKGGKGMGKEKE